MVHSRLNVDFGCGFYVTPLYEQAKKWCGKFKRRGKEGVISSYEFDESRKEELNILQFDSYSEEWLDFILNCRSGKDLSDYDLVVGGVSDMHCMSDAYLAEELEQEYAEKAPVNVVVKERIK